MLKAGNPVISDSAIHEIAGLSRRQATEKLKTEGYNELPSRSRRLTNDIGMRDMPLNSG
jgi:hypothetical protein